MRYHLVAGTTNQDSHALVWGSGLAGLLAARVLVDHFAQVTVIDQPTNLPDHQPLSIRGQMVLERLFPGITTQLMLAGAPGISWTADCPVLLPAGWLPRFPADFSSRLASPVLIERIVRQRVLEYGGSRLSFNQSIISGYAQRGKQLLGLKRDVNSIISGQVVVNTTRHHPFSLSGAVPLPTGIHLTSALFQPSDHFFADWKALLLFSDFQPLQGGWLLPLENKRWLVTLFGQPGQLPTHAESFASFAHRLRHPALSEALQSATFIDDTFQQHTFTLRRYPPDQGHWPHNLLRVSERGIFEMEYAVASATAISEALREQRRQHPNGDLTGLARRFQTRLQQTSVLPGWLTLTLFNPQLNTFQQLLKNVSTGWGRRILTAAPTDATLARLIWQVVQQDTSWRAWLKPDVIEKSLRPIPAHPAVLTLPPAPQPTLSAPTPRKMSTAELSAIVDLSER